MDMGLAESEGRKNGKFVLRYYPSDGPDGDGLVESSLEGFGETEDIKATDAMVTDQPLVLTRADIEEALHPTWVSLDARVQGLMDRLILPKLNENFENCHDLNSLLAIIDQIADKYGRAEFLTSKQKQAISQIVSAEGLDKAKEISILICAYCVTHAPRWLIDNDIEKKRNIEGQGFHFNESGQVEIPEVQFVNLNEGLLISPDLNWFTVTMTLLSTEQAKQIFIDLALGEIMKIADSYGFKLIMAPAGDLLLFHVKDADPNQVKVAASAMTSVRLKLDLQNPYHQEIKEALKARNRKIEALNGTNRIYQIPQENEVTSSVAVSEPLTPKFPLTCAYSQGAGRGHRFIFGPAYTCLVEQQKKVGKGQFYIPEGLEAMAEIAVSEKDQVNELSELPWDNSDKLKLILEAFVRRGVSHYPYGSFHGLQSLELGQRRANVLTTMGISVFSKLASLQINNQMQQFLRQIASVSAEFFGRVDIVSLYDGRAYLLGSENEVYQVAEIIQRVAEGCFGSSGGASIVRGQCLIFTSEIGAQALMMNSTLLSTGTRVADTAVQIAPGKVLAFASQALERHPERIIQMLTQLGVKDMGEVKLAVLSSPDAPPVCPPDLKYSEAEELQFQAWKEMALACRESGTLDRNKLYIVADKGMGASMAIAKLESSSAEGEESVNNQLRLRIHDWESKKPYTGFKKFYRAVTSKSLTEAETYENLAQFVSQATNEIVNVLTKQAQNNPPLVIFIDGLDRLDSASRESMNNIMGRCLGHNILFVLSQNEEIASDKELVMRRSFLTTDQIINLLAENHEEASGNAIQEALVPRITGIFDKERPPLANYDTVARLKKGLTVSDGKVDLDTQAINIDEVNIQQFIQQYDLTTDDVSILEYIGMLGQITLTDLRCIAEAVPALKKYKVEYLAGRLNVFLSLGILKIRDEHGNGVVQNMAFDRNSDDAEDSEKQEDAVFLFGDQQLSQVFGLRGDSFDRRVNYLNGILRATKLFWPVGMQSVKEQADVVANIVKNITEIRRLNGGADISLSAGAGITTNEYLKLAGRLACVYQERENMGSALEFFQLLTPNLVSPELVIDALQEPIFAEMAGSYMELLMNQDRFVAAADFGKNFLSVHQTLTPASVSQNAGLVRPYMHILYMYGQALRLTNAHLRGDLGQMIEPTRDNLEELQFRLLIESDNSQGAVTEEERECPILLQALDCSTQFSELRITIHALDEARQAGTYLKNLSIKAKNLIANIFKQADNLPLLDFNISVEALKAQLTLFILGNQDDPKIIEGRMELVKIWAYVLVDAARIDEGDDPDQHQHVCQLFRLRAETCIDAIFEAIDCRSDSLEPISSLAMRAAYQAQEYIFRMNFYKEMLHNLPSRNRGQIVYDANVQNLELARKLSTDSTASEAITSVVQSLIYFLASCYEPEQAPGNPICQDGFTQRAKQEGLRYAREAFALVMTDKHHFPRQLSYIIFNMIELALKAPDGGEADFDLAYQYILIAHEQIADDAEIMKVLESFYQGNLVNGLFLEFFRKLNDKLKISPDDQVSQKYFVMLQRVFDICQNIWPEATRSECQEQLKQLQSNKKAT